jgi:hypothetical protein
MNKIASALSVIIGIFIALIIAHPHSAAAFTSNNLIDDRVFDNANSMSAAQIDSWLNSSFPSSCISTNNGFAAVDPNGYSPAGGFTYGGPVSAGQVVYDAAQAYGINPQVLLTTLEKEEGLVKGDGPYGCSATAMASAVGYGCPDGGSSYSYSNLNPALYYAQGSPVTSISGTCVNSPAKAGFSQQLIRAAWLLAFARHRSEGDTGWSIVKGNWNNSDDPGTCYGGPMTQGTFKRCSSDPSPVFYDGYITIDSVSTHMDNGATAALYWYTPHFHGNQIFDDVFQSWFGSLYQLFTWSLVSQYAYTDPTRQTPVDLGKLGPGQRYYIGFVVQNTGNVTWTRNSANPTNVGTASPRDRASAFCDSAWLGCNRPAPLHEYSVGPGQYGSFEFWITTPSTPGSYNEIFAPLVEGITWMDSHTVSFPMIVSPASYSWTTVNQSVFTDSSKGMPVDATRLVAGQRYYAAMDVKNTSNVTWLKNGANPITLGASNPQDHSSSFCDPSWLGCNRPAALHEYVVAPGQIGSFEFWFRAPPGGSYNESFTPLAEGAAWMSGAPINFSGSTQTAFYSWLLISQYAYTDSTMQTPKNMGQLAAGQRYYIGFSLKNTGNTIWHRISPTPFAVGTASPQDRQGKFCDPTWLGPSPACNRPAGLNEYTVAPGQIGSVGFWITAPSAGSYNEIYAPLVEGITWMSDRTVSFPALVN